jgi:hypothetical protein
MRGEVPSCDALLSLSDPVLPWNERYKWTNRWLAALERGCVGGSDRCCETVARYLENSEPTRALAILQRSCALSGRSGCIGYTRFLMAGRGVPRDCATALATLGRCCAAGNSSCCNELQFYGNDLCPRPAATSGSDAGADARQARD